jgi:hypothetical protein
MKCFNTLGDYTFAPPATAASFGGDSATTFLMAQEFECTDVFPNTIAGINAENQSDLTLKLESTNSFAACTLQTFVAFDNLLILREGHLVDLVM